MYCSNCGKEIDEKKIQKKLVSDVSHEINEDTEIVYSCPRCGAHIHHDLNEEDLKSLSRAAHAEYQRGSNSFAVGMCNVCLGGISVIIAVIFFILSMKPANQRQIDPTCVEFYVSMILFALGVVLLVVGIIYVYKGIHKKHHYNQLLKDINDEVFIQ